MLLFQKGTVTAELKELSTRYFSPADDSIDGWEAYSIPMGNGFIGANIFGRTDRERIQITQNSFVASNDEGGLTDFAELYFEFGHDTAENYERKLNIDNALASVHYSCGGVKYEREYFISYPDRVMAVKFTASKDGMLNFTYSPTIPFVRDYAKTPGDGGGRTANIECSGRKAIIYGQMNCYRLQYAISTSVESDGTISSFDGKIRVENASYAVVYFCTDTNYKLSSKIFLEQDNLKKLEYEDVRPRTEAYLKAAEALGYDKLKERHIAGR